MTIPVFTDGEVLTGPALTLALQSVSDDAQAATAADLAASSGAAGVGFIQPGSAAVVRTVQGKSGETVSVTDFGATCDGVKNDASFVQAAITYANTAGRPLVEVPSSNIFMTTLTIPNNMAFGDIASLSRGKNLIPNGNFHTWQRVDVRQLSPAQFTIAPPTFGNPATYDGTGGLKVYHADMWYAQVYGLYGGSVITRKAITPVEAKITSDTEFCLNWNATSVTPPAATVKTVTNITNPTSATLTLTVPGHGKTNGDWVWVGGTQYTGGLGSLTAQANEASFQVQNATTDTFQITIAPDAGFTAWTNFGTVSNDPDNSGFAHVYDASLTGANPPRRKWQREGTSSHLMACRLPCVRRSDGMYAVRLRMRRNSGNPVIRARLYYDFGNGGSTATDTVALLAAPSSGSDIVDYFAVCKIPDISAKTFGTVDTGYFAVTLGADPTTFDVDIFSISARQGAASIPNDNWTKQEAAPYLRQFYQGVRAGVSQSATSGNYYGMTYSFSIPMRGTPTVTYVRDFTLTGFSTPTVTNNRTKEGFSASAQASATGVGIWSSLFECEYNIPT